jgi:hypothetical protein
MVNNLHDTTTRFPTGGQPLTEPPGETELAAYQALPAAASFRRLDFDEAPLLPLNGGAGPAYLLAVSGTKPYLNMDVELVPVTYVRYPEYWVIEVVGSLRGPGLPALATYTACLELAGTVGSLGIEVVGATRGERFDIPPRPALGACGEWTAYVDHQPGPDARPILRVRGECEFPTTGFGVELRRHHPPACNDRELLLDKVVHAPTGPVGQVITRVPVSYDEDRPSPLSTVTILPDGVRIPVTDVH